MQVRGLRLNSYRNYSSIHFDFSPGLNVITGRNGIGKTNVLESILFLSNTKSFRTNHDPDVIKDGTEYARIDADTDEGKFRVVISKNGKTLFHNDILIKRTSDYIGKLNAVLFKPNDLELFSQSPKDRRRLLDIEIGKVSPEYLKALLRYNSLLKDKNKLLKELEIDEMLLDLLEEAMVPQIQIIEEKRREFFEHINRHLSSIYHDLSSSDTPIEASYRPCSKEGQIREDMKKSRERDLYYHYTTYGPHHEDYSFRMGEKDLEAIASQGQKRMVLIAFKFALISYIQESSGKMPVILLDDVLSELDQDNRRRLLDHLPEGAQTIITDTDIKDIHLNREYKLIHLKEEHNG